MTSIKLLVLDVDGVLTDGRLYYGPTGESLKVFHVRDGHGLKQLKQNGIQLAVISGRDSPAVTTRCQELGITHIDQGCDDKVAAFTRLLKKLGLTADQAMVIVDDTTDLALMRAAGHSVAVADAHETVRAAATRITRLPGGQGAVREVCDWFLADLPASQ